MFSAPITVACIIVGAVLLRVIVTSRRVVNRVVSGVKRRQGTEDTHLPSKVNPETRDRWLLHMRTAVDSLELSPLDDATLWGYLDRAAHAMVNTFDA